MNCVIDTHTLVWYLAGDARLGKKAKEVLTNNEGVSIYIPTIVIAEIAYLQQKRKLTVNIEDVKVNLLSSSNVTLYPLDMSVIDEFPIGFEIHDAIIIATAKVLGKITTEEVRLITKDEEIIKSGTVLTLW